MTAAHRTLLGSVVRVTNLANNQSVFVRINDHGPFFGDRIIDLSLAAAKAIDVYRPGTAKVRVEAYAVPNQAGGRRRTMVCRIGAFLDEVDAIVLMNDLRRQYPTARVTQYAGATGHWDPHQATESRQSHRQPDRRQHSHLQTLACSHTLSGGTSRLFVIPHPERSRRGRNLLLPLPLSVLPHTSNTSSS